VASKSDRLGRTSVLLLVVCGIALSVLAVLCGSGGLTSVVLEAGHHAARTSAPDHKHQAASCPHDARSPASSAVPTPPSFAAAAPPALVVSRPFNGSVRLGMGRLLAPVPHLLCVLRT